jgi:transglutaminase superfamily protein
VPGGRPEARAGERPTVAPLTAVERARLAVEVLATYGAVRLRVRRAELPAVLASLRSAGAGPRPLPLAHDEQRLAAVAVRVLRVLPGDARCLTRSLVVLAMLARRGIDTRLVIATRPGPAFAAHAWIERAGRPLLPTEGFGDVRLVEL